VCWGYMCSARRSGNTHTLLPLRNDSADCVCRERHFLSLEHGACVLCTENHYCGGRDNQRASCPLHSYAAPGTEKLQGCVCQRGYFAFTVSSPNASTPECWLCRANTYSGQAQEHFAAECVLCPDPGVPPADVSWQAPLQQCGLCEKDAAVAPPFCLCPAGSFLTAEQQCAPCSENHVCTGGHASPVGCPLQTMFVPVGHGRSMDDCLCTAGFFRVDNQDALAEGILQNIVRPEDVGSSWCVACPVGYFCSAGNASAGGGSVMYRCPAMTSTYAQASAHGSDCQCAAGAYTVALLPNHTGTAPLCQECPANYYCPGSDSALSPRQPAAYYSCPANTVSHAGANAIQGCACQPPWVLVAAASLPSAYDCVQRVQTDAPTGPVNADSQASGFMLHAVAFDTAARVWRVEIQFEDSQNLTRRSLLLSRTQARAGVQVFAARQDQSCAPGMGEGLTLVDTVSVAQCFAGIADAFYILPSFLPFADSVVRDAVWENDQQSNMVSGAFVNLSSTNASELVRNGGEQSGADTPPASTFRTVVVTLLYDNVIDHVGIETRSGTVIHVGFFVGLATVRLEDARMSVAVTTRNILTRIGTNYVVSRDTTDAQQENPVMPIVGISLHNVRSRSASAFSWGFATFYISLPGDAIRAGERFDEADVIPVDAVVGLVAFFDDDPVYTNQYPCLYRPDAESYAKFSAVVGCSNSIQSVSVYFSRLRGVRIAASVVFFPVAMRWCAASLCSHALVRTRTHGKLTRHDRYAGLGIHLTRP